MPQIHEDTIDFVLDRVNDAADAVGIQTQAINVLSEQITDQGKVLADVHTAVTREGDDTLAKLLAEIAESGKTNTELLRQLLAKSDK